MTTSNVIITDECNVNFVHLIGKVVSDVVLSETNEKKIPVLNFRILTKQFVGSKKMITTQIHRIVCWSKLAEETAERIKKGMTVEVFGELVNRRYETTDRETGNPVVVALTEIKAFKVVPFKGRVRTIKDIEEANNIEQSKENHERVDNKDVAGESKEQE